MRVLREGLVSIFVVAVVLYLYFLAAGAALLSLCGSLHTGTDQTPASFYSRGECEFASDTYRS